MSAPALEIPQYGPWSARALRDRVRAESRKTFSTAAWWALLLPAALCSLAIGAISAKDGRLAHSQAIALGSFGVIFAALFGVVCATAEYRHHTVTTSYLGAANRPTLTVAKLVFAALVGGGYALVCAALSILGMVLRGRHVAAELPSVLLVTAGAVLVLALWAVLGVGFGTWVGNQVFGVLVILLYLLLVEPILAVLAKLADLHSYITYLPSGSSLAALDGLTGGEQFGGRFGIASPWWLMLLVFAGYTAVITLVGTGAAQRRDIT